MRAALIFAISFFAFMTVYNVVMAIRGRVSFAPAIAGALMTVAVCLIMAEETFYATLFLAAAALVSFVKLSEASRTLGKGVAGDLRKIGSGERFRPTDLLLRKGMARAIARYGPRKAALFCASLMAGVPIVAVALYWSTSSGMPHDRRLLWVGLLVAPPAGVLFLYFFLSKAFERALDDLKRQ